MCPTNITSFCTLSVEDGKTEAEDEIQSRKTGDVLDGDAGLIDNEEISKEKSIEKAANDADYDDDNAATGTTRENAVSSGGNEALQSDTHPTIESKDIDDGKDGGDDRKSVSDDDDDDEEDDDDRDCRRRRRRNESGGMVLK